MSTLENIHPTFGQLLDREAKEALLNQHGLVSGYTACPAAARAAWHGRSLRTWERRRGRGWGRGHAHRSPEKLKQRGIGQLDVPAGRKTTRRCVSHKATAGRSRGEGRSAEGCGALDLAVSDPSGLGTWT